MPGDPNSYFISPKPTDPPDLSHTHTHTNTRARGRVQKIDYIVKDGKIDDVTEL